MRPVGPLRREAVPAAGETGGPREEELVLAQRRGGDVQHRGCGRSLPPSGHQRGGGLLWPGRLLVSQLRAKRCAAQCADPDPGLYGDGAAQLVILPYRTTYWVIKYKLTLTRWSGLVNALSIGLEQQPG
ncbi:hypothetical protein NDU88_001457 [Pleurodeles waltl]|uniref:Uncharacterized protein n=1 Tax=Pleurodeles waltl TaxID=8319 RepID=A0AAV7L0T1_PLEWA|nr:hypothetical protein NDU88_001457 [Pleurodeles waltl]